LQVDADLQGRICPRRPPAGRLPYEATPEPDCWISISRLKAQDGLELLLFPPKPASVLQGPARIHAAAGPDSSDPRPACSVSISLLKDKVGLKPLVIPPPPALVLHRPMRIGL